MKALYNNSNRHICVGHLEYGGIELWAQMMLPLHELSMPESYIERANNSSYLEIIDVDEIDNSDKAIEERVAAAKERTRLMRNSKARAKRAKLRALKQ